MNMLFTRGLFGAEGETELLAVVKYMRLFLIEAFSVALLLVEDLK